MLRVSKLADYGTVIMVYLARRAKLCSARDVSNHTHLSMPTVTKILKQLTLANLLISERGIAGGYRLIRPAANISVSEIIFALDKSKGLTECRMHPEACFLQPVCSIQGNWRLISEAIESALDSISLEMLGRPKLLAGDLLHMKNIVLGESRGEI